MRPAAATASVFTLAIIIAPACGRSQLEPADQPSAGVDAAAPVVDAASPAPLLGCTRQLQVTGPAPFVNVNGVAADSHHDLIIVGAFVGQLAVGRSVLDNATDGPMYAIDLDAACAPRWARALGGGGAQLDLQGVTVAPDGTRVLTGGATGDVDFGFQLSPGASSHGDAIVIALEPGGEMLWTQRFVTQTGESASGRSVAPDPASGGVVVAGQFTGTVDFGGGPVTSAGDLDVFLVGLDARGQHQFSRGYGGMLGDLPLAVAVDPVGRIGLGGVRDRQMGEDLVVSHLLAAGFDATAGSVLWTASSAGWSDRGDAIAATAAQTFVMAGSGSGPGTTDGNSGTFLSALDAATGAVLWNQPILPAGPVLSLAVLPASGDIVLATWTYFPASDGGAPSGVMLSRYDRSGRLLRTMPFAGLALTAGITADERGIVSLVGISGSTIVVSRLAL
jgi:outer membrane protein assembly factor BamB